MVFSCFHGYSLEDYFRTARKDRYNLMCSIKVYEKLHQLYSDSASSGGSIPLPDGSTKYISVSLGNTLNFIESWIQSFQESYYK